MKSLLWLSVAAVALSAAASAATVTCTPHPFIFDNGGGAAGADAVINCGAFGPDAGFSLTSVTITIIGDYLQGTTGVFNDVRETYSPNGPAGVIWTPPSQFVDITGGFSSGPAVTMDIVGSNFTNTSFLSGFSVGVNSKVLAGAVFKSTANVTVDFTQSPTVPEPSTLGVLGAGLLGIGVLGRRRK